MAIQSPWPVSVRRPSSRGGGLTLAAGLDQVALGLSQ
jgi:hypothetical protein